MITLTDGAISISLPPDLEWTDEFSWQKITDSMDYSVNGALIVESFTRQTGRHITLESPQQQAVISRATLKILKSWADIPGKVMQLTLRNIQHNVKFRCDAPPIEAEEVGYWPDPKNDSILYFITLRLLEL